MKATVLLGHPYEKSFNYGIYTTVIDELKKQKVEVFAHDLYAENFNPVLTKSELGKEKSTDPLVNQYVEELLASDLLIIIHPNWWGQPPAIIKGYVDRVLRPPHAYDFPEGASGGGLPIGKLKGKKLIIFNTSNTSEDREINYFGDPLENIWKQCVAGFCDMTDFQRKMFCIIADSDEEQRKNWLLEVRDDIKALVNKSI